ncbi:MAG: flavodoxin-dependent (E)-4-hydroxy-3-methylbut-2-enyl-diphosphate synthase [Candidatus Omnitrophica bacterium]|nr:flavodoxin-dependent (E)-4-hydroxy-3-methylbut-2-enyl-diphosphate synthase [Candidatus Omnitrophota bacterium]
MIRRRKTKVIKVGSVKIGGNNPISIQSMLKVRTADLKKAVTQARRLEDAGCEILRVSIKDKDDAKAINTIKKKISMPVVADIHFNHHLALDSIKSGADKIRINPGNISNPAHLKEIITASKKKKIPIRIGINSGSLAGRFRNKGIVACARKYIKFFEGQGFRDIIISLKSSDVAETVFAYRKLAGLCDYPLHLGVTAAGPEESGIIKSSIGIGALLLEGIGDTVRVSLTADPIDEVIAAKNILASLRLRNFGPNIISCPTCGRCQVNLPKIVEEMQCKLDSPSKPYKCVRTIAIMGCEVNGPGEARQADIGIAFGKNAGVLFKKGKILKKVPFRNAVRELHKLILS